MANPKVTRGHFTSAPTRRALLVGLAAIASGRARSQETEEGLLPPALRDAIAELEVSSEQYYRRALRRPYFPGGESGVTIGIGTDLRFQSVEQFEADWKPAIGERQVHGLIPCIGVGGRPAGMSYQEHQTRMHNLCRSLSWINISWEAACTVFGQSTIPRYVRTALRTFPNLAQLDAHCLGSITSLVMNRGSALRSSNPVRHKTRREMREIHRLMQTKSFKEVPDQIRAMNWVWDNQPAIKAGMVKRREHEARMFETGLEIMGF